MKIHPENLYHYFDVIDNYKFRGLSFEKMIFFIN